MKFELTATIEKELWSSNGSYLYKVNEKQDKKDKGWTVFTKEPCNFGITYSFTGYVSESPDKKVVDQNGKKIYRMSFNATHVKELGQSNDFGPEPKFNNDESIPF